MVCDYTITHIMIKDKWIDHWIYQLWSVQPNWIYQIWLNQPMNGSCDALDELVGKHDGM